MATIITDPIILYIVVRESLSMPPKKICSQACHLVEKILMNYMKLVALSVKKDLKGLIPENELVHIKITTEWIDHHSPNEIRKANEEQWVLLKNEFGKNAFVIKDLEEELLGFWPIHESQVSQTIRQLSSL